MDERAVDPENWQQAIEQHDQDLQGDDTDDDFAVWPENWQTVRIFLSLSRCWRQDSMSGQFLGIPRADIESTLNMWNVRPIQKRAILDNLTVMEGAALEVLNRK
jgi:hypothetical protein